MSADDGMDGTDWQARAEEAERRSRQLEHSNRVLTEHLEVLRRRMDDRLTVWDRYATAILTGLIPALIDRKTWNDGHCISDAALAMEVSVMADAMMAERARRAKE